MPSYQTDLFYDAAKGRTASQLLISGVEERIDGNTSEAIQLIIAAVKRDPSNEALLVQAAHEFSQLGAIGHACDCWERLNGLKNLTAGHLVEYASDLAKLGFFEKAVHNLYQALIFEPENFGYKIQLSSVLGQEGKYRRAALVLLSGRHAHSNEQSYWQYVASALRNAGKLRVGLKIARQLLDIHPKDWTVRNLCATILVDQAKYLEAKQLLADGGPEVRADTSQMLAIVAQRLGDDAEALVHISRAIKAAGTELPYLMQRASIYSALHKYDLASADYVAVSLQAPHDLSAKRSAFVTLVQAGQYADALSFGGALVADAPTDRDMLITLQAAIERSENQNRAGHSFSDGMASEKLNERFGAPPTVDRAHSDLFKNPILLQWRVILALILRETRTRFGRSRFGYAWVIFEPLAHIGIMITLISVIGHSGKPPLGESFALFYFTGIIPYILFTHTAGHLMHSVAENRPLLQLPKVRVLDVYIARAILELLTGFCVAFLLLLGFWILRIDIVPLNPIGVLAAFILIWIAAIGVGLIGAVLGRFFSGWSRLWGAVTSILYFASGTFFIPRMMPEVVRDILSWIPTLQVIEMVRVNYFSQPYPYWLDVGYLIRFAFIALAIGLLLERLFRRKMLEVE